MTIKRIKEFPQLEAQLLKLLYEKVKKTCKDGQWRRFEGKFQIKDRWYSLECEFRLDDMFMSFSTDKTIKDGQDRLILPGHH